MNLTAQAIGARSPAALEWLTFGPAAGAMPMESPPQVKVESVSYEGVAKRLLSVAGEPSRLAFYLQIPPASKLALGYAAANSGTTVAVRVARDGQPPRTLFEGSAREGVPHFPQNVNIAAVLSLAGIGPDRTRLKVVADPGLTFNTHTIRVSGRTGRFSVVLENVPMPENPKTSWLACASALSALRALAERVRYGG